MPTPPPDNTFDRLLRALTPADPTNDPYGDHKLRISGTVNILGGGAGGTSQTDDANYLPGSSSLTPIGGYYGGRSIGSGHAAAPALSGSAILQVDVVAGGAGGGVAQNQIQGTSGAWVSVGIASGNAGAAGNYALPVVYASGVYATVNVGNAHGIFGSVSVVGSVNVTPVASFTVNLGSIPTVNLGLGTVNVGAMPGLVGSVFVTPLASFTVNLGSIPTVNIGLGTVNVGNAHGVFGSVGAGGLGGSVGVIYLAGSAAVTTLSANTTSQVMLVGNAARRGAAVFNDSTATLLIAFGVTATASTFVLRMRPSDYYEMPQPAYTGTVNAAWGTATGWARVTELLA